MSKNQTKNMILQIVAGSKAEALGIEEGDELLTINHECIEDIIEYIFLTTDEYLEIEIEKKDGFIKTYQVYKEFDEELGLIFENPIIDEAKSCKNKCIFCFVDQLPPNMRETLYFKDDDSRLSFLQGNFITLTNMTEHDIDKIIKYRISPLNISVHTTDPKLRVKMLNNKTAGNIYERLQKLASAGIRMNAQIVLCPGINDKENLNKTIRDLSILYPYIESVAIVPVGITKFRKGLYPLTTFNQDSSFQVIQQVERWQKKLFNTIHTRFVYLSDEFYIMAQTPLPEYDTYEGFPQLENGVGMIAKFEYEFFSYLKDKKSSNTSEKIVSIATGESAGEFIKKWCQEIENKFTGIKINVFPIKNYYFGETITVAGLVTATDIINQLQGKQLGNQLLIPSSMLKAGEPIFLDDKSIDDLQSILDIEVVVSDVNGKDFIDKIVE